MLWVQAFPDPKLDLFQVMNFRIMGINVMNLPLIFKISMARHGCQFLQRQRKGRHPKDEYCKLCS